MTPRKRRWDARYKTLGLVGEKTAHVHAVASLTARSGKTVMLGRMLCGLDERAARKYSGGATEDDAEVTCPECLVKTAARTIQRLTPRGDG